MPLEAGTLIPDLDANNPLGADPKSEGDDHLRLVKRCVLGSFPGLVGTTAIPKAVTLTEDQINDAALKSAAQTISGIWQHDATLRLANQVALVSRNAANTADLNLVSTDSLDRTTFGTVDSQQINQCKTQNQFLVDGVTVAFMAGLPAGGLVAVDREGISKKAGFRNPSLSTFSADRTLDQDDEGRVLQMTAGPVTLTVDQLEAFTAMRIITTGAGGDLTLLKGTITNMRLLDGGGSLNQVATGITVVRNSIVELYWQSATTMYVFGNGLTGF